MHRLLQWYLSWMGFYILLAALGSAIVSFMVWAIGVAIFNLSSVTLVDIWWIVFFLALLIVTVCHTVSLLITVIKIRDLQHSFNLSFDDSFDACVSYDLLRKQPKGCWSRGVLLEEIRFHRMVEMLFNL